MTSNDGDGSLVDVPHAFPSSLPDMKSERWIVLTAVIAMALKLWWALSSDGSNDVVLFYLYGKAIHSRGLLGMYGPPLFNHTPLVGWFVGAVYEQTGGAGRHFAFWLRFPGILADFVTVLALLWVRRKISTPPQWVLALFALSPVSLMVSGYHGNVDPLLVCALTLAACCGVGGKPGWSGFALGLACQVKVIGLIAAPALAFWWWNQNRARPFFLTAAATILIGWSVPLISIPFIFLRNVLAYPSYWGGWGISLWLTQTGSPAFRPNGLETLTPIENAISISLRLTIVFTALAIAWARRRGPGADLFSTLTMTWLVFFALAPGCSAQYLIWLAPFAALTSPWWFTALTLASTAFLWRFYSAISGPWPWIRGTSTREAASQWLMWTNLPWAVVLFWLIWWVPQEFRKRSPARLS